MKEPLRHFEAQFAIDVAGGYTETAHARHIGHQQDVTKTPAIVFNHTLQVEVGFIGERNNGVLGDTRTSHAARRREISQNRRHVILPRKNLRFAEDARDLHPEPSVPQLARDSVSYRAGAEDDGGHSPPRPAAQPHAGEMASQQNRGGACGPGEQKDRSGIQPAGTPEKRCRRPDEEHNRQ